MHPKYDASLVCYQEIIPVRVLRVKVCHDSAAFETLNIYQHVWTHTDEPEHNKQRRQALLDKLAGDFNSEVQSVATLIGHRLNRSEYHMALDPR